tara:strand:+ start:280 stop:489 length:210 start_codon:yes stop_codon:yes gene_type:complete
MRLLDELRLIAERSREEQIVLAAALQLLKDQQIWRQAWIDAERRVDLLTNELSMLKLSCNLRKEKENDD